MRKSGTAQDDAARYVDVIAGGDKVADDVEKCGHGFARENVPGKENAREKGEKSELNGFGLRIGFTGDENADGKRDEKVRQRE